MKQLFLSLSIVMLAMSSNALEYAYFNPDDNSEYQFLMCSEEAEKVAQLDGDAEYIPAFDRCMEVTQNDSASNKSEKIIVSR